jgi:WD40 repeat protein
MNRHFLWLCLVPIFTLPIGLSAQELPPRFQAIAKEGRIRLTSILGTPELQPAYSATTAFSADGKRAIYVEDLSSGNDDKPILRSRLIVTTPQSPAWPREFEVPGKSVTALALSADGSKVLLTGLTYPEKEKEARTYLSVWDLNAGKEIYSFLTKERPPLCAALAADGTTALLGTFDAIKRWDLKTGRELSSHGEKGKAQATALAYLPGDKQFLVGTRDGTIQRFDVNNGNPGHTYQCKGDHSFVWHLTPSADGKRFVSGDFQHGVTLWETSTGKEINIFKLEKRTSEEVITSVTLANDAKTVLLTWAKSDTAPDDFAGTKLYAWDGETKKINWSYIVPYRGRLPILALGDKLLIGGGPNLFDVWDWKQGKKLQSWGGHKGTVNALTVTHDGTILSAGQEGSIMTWREGLLVGKTPAHSGAVICMCVGPDRKRWLTVGTDQTTKLWSAQADKPLQTLKGHAGPLTSVAFDSSGKFCVTGSGDRTAKTWDLTTGKELASFAGHSEGVNAVAISPDDRWLATGSDDATIRVWPIKDGKLDPSREAIVLEKHTKGVTCLTFTPDGKKLISGSQDQKAIAWNWQKGSMDFMIPGHKNWINSILLLDANTLVTSSDDLSVCVWDLTTGMEIGRVDFGAVGDCPRCLTKLGPDRFAVGTSSWLIYELQVVPAKSKGGIGSSK